MTSKTARTVLSLSALALVVTGGILFAGPLNPPAGPVTSTYKTLTEVEPRIAINATNTPGTATSVFRITQAGSYYLTGNAFVAGGLSGIEITTANVTIDLNGFVLSGIGANKGIVITGTSATHVVVRNGAVRSFGTGGIDLGMTPYCSVDHVTVDAVGAMGIKAGGSSARVSDCHVSGVTNSGTGIEVGLNAVVERCTATNNTGIGIRTGTTSTISNCTSTGNADHGFYADSGSTVAQCAARGNSFMGIACGNGCTVVHCNASANTLSGIHPQFGSTVSNCTANANLIGISAFGGCTIVECAAYSNSANGISCESDCLIRGNTCGLNGNGGSGAGIHATSIDNRIEGNNCTGADRGIQVDSAGNIIIQNTCSGNTTNWVIATSNYYGPIIDRTGIFTAAVNGPAAAGTLATTDPNANFSY